MNCYASFFLFITFALVMKIRRFIFLLIALWMVSSVMIARQKIGLVLGGGGAKGAAEVGVLKVLEEAGVKPDYIVGTSIGSIVGGLYAAGYTATELETMFKTQEWLSLLTDRDAALSNEPYTTKNGITYIFGFPIIDNKSKIGVEITGSVLLIIFYVENLDVGSWGVKNDV